MLNSWNCPIWKLINKRVRILLRLRWLLTLAHHRWRPLAILWHRKLILLTRVWTSKQSRQFAITITTHPISLKSLTANAMIRKSITLPTTRRSKTNSRMTMNRKCMKRRTFICLQTNMKLFVRSKAIEMWKLEKGYALNFLGSVPVKWSKILAAAPSPIIVKDNKTMVFVSLPTKNTVTSPTQISIIRKKWSKRIWHYKLRTTLWQIVMGFSITNRPVLSTPSEDKW